MTHPPSGPSDTPSGPAPSDPTAATWPPPRQSSGAPSADPTQAYPSVPPSGPSYGPSYAPGHASPYEPQYGQQFQPTEYQPQYGQPPYGPPSYGQPPYGGAPYSNPASPRRLPVAAIVVIVVAVVILAAIGGYFALRPASKAAIADGSSAAATTPATTPATSPAPTGSAAPSSHATNSLFTLPKSVDGMALAPDMGLGNEMSNALPNGLAASTTTGLYTDPSNATKILILIGAQTKVADPELALAGAFAGMSGASQAKLGTAKHYPAGPLGGAMECAAGHLTEGAASLPVGVCVVADTKGIIVSIFTSRSASQAATATRNLRREFEHH
jgi:hypothetical protein